MMAVQALTGCASSTNTQHKEPTMADPFVNLSSSLDSPAAHAVAVTPSNSVDLTTAARALYIGVAGDVKVDMVGGETAVTFTAVPVGFLPVRVTRVYATGTTATGIVAVY